VTQYIGLIGYPLKHSISPEFQQAALDYYGLDIRYESWEVKAGDMTSVINRLRQPRNLGANVTVPYKETLIGLMDELAELARIVGAVNTVLNKDGKLAGHNTDGCGFLKALREDAGFEPKNKDVMILGAGGAARAVSFKLVSEKVGSIIIANRSLGKADNLAKALRQWAATSDVKLGIRSIALPSPEIEKETSGCQLIVNCTILGMRYSPDEGKSPLPKDAIPKGALVYDLVYNPLQTPLLTAAEVAGAGILGGLPMLVYQGAASFKLWTGREAPIDIMLDAAKKALAGSGG